MPSVRDLRRWIRHNRNLQGFSRIWELGGQDPGSPRLVAPWLSDTIQLTTAVQPTYRQISLATPAPQVNFTQSVDLLEFWKLISVQFVFTTDANVVNRVARLAIRDENGNTVFIGIPAQFQAANLARVYSCSSIGADTFALLSAHNSMMLPYKFPMPGGYSVASSTSSFQAGDQYSQIHLFFEIWPGA